MKFVLVGGGEIGRPIIDKQTGEFTGKYQPMETLSIGRKIIELSGKKNPKLLFLPTASEGPSRIFEIDGKSVCSYEYVVREYFGKKLGASVDALYLIDQNPTDDEIHEKIAAADIFYVGGGNTRQLIDTWKKFGVDVLLKAAIDRGAVASGISAGANCWCKYASTDSDGQMNLGIMECLGFLPFLMTPHCISGPLRKPFTRKMIETEYQNETAICLDDCSALVIDGDKMSVLSSNENSHGVKMFLQNGKIIEEPIEQLQEQCIMQKIRDEKNGKYL
jgi:dipeptidase E